MKSATVLQGHDLYFRYVTCDTKVSSSVVDMIRKDIPEYLHGRPHWFVQHCITHIQNATELDPDSVIQMISDAFQVPRQYTVAHRAK